MKIKDCIRGQCRFNNYQDGMLWYVADNGFAFPIPVADLDGARINDCEDGIYLMRWIRKHLDYIADARKES